ncbi:MAG: alpha/beta fold hydrolase, partial [Kouleothrix sp.]
MTLLIQNGATQIIDEGAGEPTLLLHGVPDSGEMWRGVIAQLAPRFRCIAPDLPGMGRSAAPAGFD